MPVPLSLKKPEALELFTDRVTEQQALRRTLAPGDGSPEERSLLVTVFYGVGGVGKTTLCRRALQIAGDEFGASVTCAHTSVDDQRWKQDCGVASLTVEICRTLLAQKIPTPLTAALLALWNSVAEGSGGVEERWQTVIDAADKGVEVIGIPGLSLVVKGALHVRDCVRRRELRKRLEELNLWPGEAQGRAVQGDVEGKLPQALFHDVADWLRQRPGQQLRLFLDGFERIQGSENRPDGQRGLSNFLGYFDSAPDVGWRFRAIVFGREKLRWDEIYDDAEWCGLWNQHILGGLAEQDARHFLDKAADWRDAHARPAEAGVIRRMRDRILDAADERIGGCQVFYPYSLDLAVDLVDRAGGREPELGHAPAELQERFLRYLEERELSALMILAIAESFDGRLFDWLADKRLINYEVHSLPKLVDGHSYFQETDDLSGERRFHRQMEAALQKKWLQASRREQGRQIVQDILDYHKGIIGCAPVRDWGEKELKAWDRGMEIIITQGPELGLLGPDEWSALLKESPWSEEHYLMLSEQMGYLARVLACQEKALGPEHPDTLMSINNMAKLFSYKGDYAAAEPLYRRALEGREKALGSDHPDTLSSVNTLANLLLFKGDYAAAEPLYRRALEGREKALGPDHPDTLSSVNNLANPLKDKGDYAAAELLYRRALEGREKALGHDHPDTLSSVNNLAILLKEKGDYAAAELLYQRALEGREKALGPDHPSTLSSVNNLALLLKEKGDYAAAELLYRRALEGREKALGPDHPSTLSSVNNLANLLKAKGDYAAAEPLYRRALEGREKALGHEHPRTLRIVNDLGSLLRKTRGVGKSVELLRHYAVKAVACMNAVRYNLACSECLSGNIAEAKRLIVHEIAADQKLKEQALADSDFADIHDFIQAL